MREAHDIAQGVERIERAAAKRELLRGILVSGNWQEERGLPKACQRFGESQLGKCEWAGRNDSVCKQASGYDDRESCCEEVVL